MLKLAVIAGDGIGPEVTTQGLRCLDKLSKAAGTDGFQYQVTQTPFSGARYLKENIVITDDELAELRRNYDAIYLGAVGRPDVAPGIMERGLLLKLRFELDLFVNLRPVKLYPGVQTPLAGKTGEHIDMVVVRENTEDLYCGVGGILRKGTRDEVAVQEMMATRMGVDRCLRYAFELCRARNRKDSRKGKKLTLVGKTNVLTYAQDLWMRAFTEMGTKEYPDITREYHHVDACCMYMVLKPEVYDVLVTGNMFGDIITDLGAAIAGGMGVAASGNLDPTGKSPSIFEPIHGSAPDIAGQNKANPIAAILSIAMLLQQTGTVKKDAKLIAAGDRLEAAVMRVCPRFAGMPFDRLPMPTHAVTDLVLAEL
ncbi:MAG: 3-isopropylmalate dehydrogenase [Phycisphaeraceae bacterium]|nr:3-isopropylmalate dehydrogenase [Phycisphaeraceae bacterium]